MAGAVGRLLAMLAILLVAVSVAAPLARAQETILVVVDLQRILREAKAVQSLQAELSAAREAFQADIRGREERLRELDQQLAKERTGLPPEVYAERRQELAALFASLQSDIQERRRQLDQAMNEGMRQVQSALLPIIQSLAEEQGAALVLAKTSVVLVRPDLEITTEALTELDAALPAVTLAPGN